MRIVWRSLLDFFRHDGPMLAGSITCFFMMSVAPFLLLLVAIFGTVLGERPEFYDFMAARIADFFPAATSGVLDEFQKIIAYRRVDPLTLGLYAYFSYQLYFAFERAVNIIFESPGKRSFLNSILFSLLVATTLLVLLFLAFGVKIALSFLEPLSQFFPGIKVGKMAQWIMAFVLPGTLLFITMSALYMVLPQKRAMFRHALLGALFTTVFLEAGKHLFTYYTIVKVSQFGMVYGSLTAVVVFLLWVFYAACIFLVGAEIVKNLKNSTRRSLDSVDGS